MKVLYIGHYKESSGWSTAAINNILALDSVGIDVVCRNIKLTDKEFKVPKRVLELEENNTSGATHCIQHVLPHHFTATQEFKKNVAYYFAESIFTRKNKWHDFIDMADEIWVSNNDMKDNTSKFVKPKINIVEIATDITKYQKEYNNIFTGMDESSFKFYFIGDLNDRKNLQSIIRSYYHTFSLEDCTTLFCKIKKHGSSSDSLEAYARNLCNSLQKEMRMHSRGSKYPNIKFITDDVEEDFINQLHANADCFVGASHGEAWSIPAFEAMCFNNTPICSNEGGPKDFIDKQNKSSGYLIDGVYDVCSHNDSAFGHIFTGSELWFHPSEKSISDAMRYYYENRNHNISKEHIQKFSYETIGKKMGDFLNE